MTETNKPGRGGQRPGAGRPKRHPESARVRKIRLTPTEEKTIRLLGQGDLTQGVVALLARLRGTYRRL